MGPAPATSHFPASRRPITGSRPAASWTPPGAGFAGRAPPGPLTRTEPLTRIGSSRETGHARAPGRTHQARGPVRHAPITENTDKRPVKPPLDTAPLLQG